MVYIFQNAEKKSKIAEFFSEILNINELSQEIILSSLLTSNDQELLAMFNFDMFIKLKILVQSIIININ